MSTRRAILLALWSLATLAALPALAENPARAPGAEVYDNRHWTLGLPIWIPGYRGEFAVGDITIGGETTGGSGFFERFFDNDLSINYFFMGSASYRWRRWRFYAEVFGGKFTDDVTFKLTSGTVVSASVRPSVPRAKAEYRVSEYNLGAPGQWTVQIWGFAGLRYYDIAVEALVGSSALQAKKAWVDPTVGLWIPAYLSRKWGFELEADIGGFDIGSRLSWQVQGLAAYRFSDLISLNLGFTYLDVDYRGTVGNDTFVFKSSVLGPRTTLTFDF